MNGNRSEKISKSDKIGKINRKKPKTLAQTAGVFFLLICLIFPLLFSFSVSVTPVSATALTAWANTPPSGNPAGGEKEGLLLSSFTTYFDGDNIPRSHNIRLAAFKLNGVKIMPNEEFSFNERVGKRTKENGFLDAVVIFDGQFVLGVGGGVCQVSTTLYNALLVAGMGITKARSHTLQVGYVPPSQDAMVSTSSDLCFINPTPAPVAISMRAGRNSVTAQIYGKKSNLTYRVESEVLKEIPPPPPQVVKGEKDGVLRAPKNGLKSQSFLLCYRHGKLIERRLIRRDSYAYIQGVEQRVTIEERTEKGGEKETGESAVDEGE